ncbi:hypothetical protein L228DRAFT_270155 [Xylona heveae TC161]|uniref:Altered inheritance of mitochondria protein 9, mitochondrial n=1 Tax=Xylona heveae (strain CBS 132557 / TC161) TaxID=1328760 RepID=A0A165FEK2_XYLHT|nr:hypothetical protein L228DRAFT_270155 [Xylona heveae TC161]KZF20888.1 hypothetical protein L228DRAFT_270155 [Xylona heveae TC161]
MSTNREMDASSEYHTKPDPVNYTSGRWLRGDKLQRDARHIKFDFDALCRRVIELCPGAELIASYVKMEGGFNRVFIFTMDNSKQIVARLPFVPAGPPTLVTASEVATIKYLQTRTSIPVPSILDWSNDARNRIGAEYIIMEHAVGVQLHKIWPAMADDQQVRCIDAIYRKLKEVVDMDFPAFGCLYFADTPLDPASKIFLDEDFCIGPHCGPRYWDCNVGEPRYYHRTRPNRGPWTNLNAYCDGLIDAGLSRIPLIDSETEKQPLYQGSVRTHNTLLECGRAVLKQMSADPRIQDAATPVLFHPDLHKRNIFVSEEDPAELTAILDWQAGSIEPAFWYADEVPDFATPVDPDHDLCTRAFNLCSQFLTPKLSGPRSMDENLFRPFRYSYRTWKDGAVALRHELIETSRHWTELGFVGTCAYAKPTLEELSVHQKEYRYFEAAQNLRRDLSSLLDIASDGWVPLENWEATKSAQKDTFIGILHAVSTNEPSGDDEPIQTEQDLKSIWPFDLDD